MGAEVERSRDEFDFERLHVYQRALDFTDRLFRASLDFPNKVQSSLGDQLRRAGLSIINNIAEGSDKGSRKEKAYFYATALHSARECIPMLSLSLRQNLIDQSVHKELRAECQLICRMLKKLAEAVGRAKA